MLMRWGYRGVLLMLMLAGCGSSAPSLSTTGASDDPIAPIGQWSLEYVGKCAGREAETIDIMVLNDETIDFGEFVLSKDEDGAYVGRIESIAPMPADGRDIVFETVIEVTQENRTTFSGTETITESGKSSDDCPIQFVYIGDDE